MRLAVSRYWPAILIASITTAAASSERTDNYLANLAVADTFHIVEVLYRPEGAAAHTVLFGDLGGGIDRVHQTVHGQDVSGEPVSLALDEVAWIRICLQDQGSKRFVALKLDAALGRPTWPPRGPLIRAVLIDGTIIEFHGMAPNISLPPRELSWYGPAGNEVKLPLARLAWVEHEHHDGNSPRWDLPDDGVVTAVDTRSGNTIDLNGRHGTLDLERGRILGQDPVWETDLDSVARLTIGPVPEIAPAMLGLEPEWAAGLVDQLDPGQRIRLDVVDKGRVTGTLTGYGNGEITMQTEYGEDLLVAETDVTRFQVSEGVKGNAGKGAVIGGLILGIAGAASAGALAGSSMGFGGGGGDSGEIAGAAFAGFFAGALVGGVVGAGIGGVSRTEHFKDLESIAIGPAMPTSSELAVRLVLNF